MLLVMVEVVVVIVVCLATPGVMNSIRAETYFYFQLLDMYVKIIIDFVIATN